MMGKFILSAFADEVGKDLIAQMNALDEHGIKFIEMRRVDGKELVCYSLDETKEIKKQMDARGFRLSSVGSPIGKISVVDDFESHLELFKHTIEVAKIMDCRFIRMFSFYIPDGEAAEKYRDEVMERLNRLIKAAEGRDIILLHENEKRIYGDTAERCLDIFKTMNCCYLKAVFDPANFIQCNIETYPKAYELLKDYIVYMHIKDAVLSEHRVVPAGYGDGKVKEILSDLYDNGYEGFLSLEPHLNKFDRFADLDSDIRSEDMPDGRPRKFAVAVKALNKITSEIYMI